MKFPKKWMYVNTRPLSIAHACRVGPPRAHGSRRNERSKVRRVAEIVRIGAAREARARGRLDGDDSYLAPTPQLRAQERKHDAGEIGTATSAADDHVGIVVGHLHLRHGFLPDHCLMEQHVVQYAAERVLGVVALRGDLDRLGDRDAQTPRMIGALRENRAARLRFARGRCDATRAVGFHQRAAVRLLVVRYAHHEHLDVESDVFLRAPHRRLGAESGLRREV